MAIPGSLTQDNAATARMLRARIDEAEAGGRDFGERQAMLGVPVDSFSLLEGDGGSSSSSSNSNSNSSTLTASLSPYEELWCSLADLEEKEGR